MLCLWLLYMYTSEDIHMDFVGEDKHHKELLSRTVEGNVIVRTHYTDSVSSKLYKNGRDAASFNTSFVVHLSSAQTATLGCSTTLSAQGSSATSNEWQKWVSSVDNVTASTIKENVAVKQISLSF